MMLVLETDLYYVEWFSFFTKKNNWKQNSYDIQTMARK